MNKIIIVILICSAFKAQCQERVFKFSELDCLESFFIKPDSFIYKHSCGLMFGETSGTIRYTNDTLVLNSSIQPLYKYKHTIGSGSNNDSVFIIVKNINFPNHIGIRLAKGGKHYDLNLQDANMIAVVYDSIDNSTKYAFSSKIFTRKEKLSIVLYRTNLNIALDRSVSKANQYKIEFEDLPDLTDYHFFTNKKAIFKEDNLILLDGNAKPETTWYPVISKKGSIRIKNKKVKIYKKCT